MCVTRFRWCDCGNSVMRQRSPGRRSAPQASQRVPARRASASTENARALADRSRWLASLSSARTKPACFATASLPKPSAGPSSEYLRRLTGPLLGSGQLMRSRGRHTALGRGWAPTISPTTVSAAPARAEPRRSPPAGAGAPTGHRTLTAGRVPLAAVRTVAAPRRHRRRHA